MTQTSGREALLEIERSAVDGYPRFSDEELQRRSRFLESAFARHELDAILVIGSGSTSGPPIQYFTNWPPRRVCYLVVMPGELPVLHVRLRNHIPNALEVLVEGTVDRVEFGGFDHETMVGNVAEELAATSANNGRIGVIGQIPQGDMAVLQRHLDAFETVSLNTEFGELRKVKSDEEMPFVRVAAHFTEAGLASLQEGLKPGQREYEIEGLIHRAYAGSRAQPVINFAMSTSMIDPDCCVPRQQLSDRVIRAGDIVVTEISASYWGYSSQILRTIVVDSEPTAEVEEMHQLAEQVCRTILEWGSSQLTVGNVLDAAETIEAAGYTILDDLMHGYGGGGYLDPVIRTRETDGSNTAEGTAIAVHSVNVIQPNITRRDHTLGVQAGDAFVLTPEGPRNLQTHPLKLLRSGTAG